MTSERDENRGKMESERRFELELNVTFFEISQATVVLSGKRLNLP